MQLELLNDQGQATSKVDAPDTLFARDYNEALVHQVVVAFQANARQGTRAQKNRETVKHSTKKPWRQKGTGRARAGTIRSPLWRGGGTTFGPHPRDHRLKVNKQTKRLALKSSLTARAADGDIMVLKAMSFDAPKTSAFASMLRTMEAYPRKKALVVVDKADDAMLKSARNIAGVRVALANEVTTYDIVWADKIVLTSAALQRMEEVYAS
jgi:large subunit ribosomal protein L4